MRILGIDPGFDRVGVCILEKVNNQYKYIFSCLISTDKSMHLYERIFEISRDLEQIIKKFEPQKAVIEKVFFSNNQKTAIDVAQSRGVICLECVKNGVEVIDVSPSQMKLAVTGDGNASKDQVKEMVFRQLKLKSSGKIIDDSIDAIALCLML
ncbi:crossover junction endodeoxyribonuclease RuvC [bacterium]|jgi:crossover junction endodeoxyribonuclease RuvC|nr:crossover junction endodeoxyribonuclease RuvC [bacterium]MBT6293593.1 crossover junction endodeoxyribonuclease RuvC [bacterium]